MIQQRKRGKQNTKAKGPPPHVRRLSPTVARSKPTKTSIRKTVLFLVVYASLVLYGASVVGYSSSETIGRSRFDPQALEEPSIRTSEQLLQPPPPVPRKRNIFTKTKMWLKKVVDKSQSKKKSLEHQPSTLSDTDYVIEIDDDSGAEAGGKVQLGSADPVLTSSHAISMYPTAFSQQPAFSDVEVKLLEEFSQRVLRMSLPLNDDDATDIQQHLAMVPWGGSYEWFTSVKNGEDALDQIQGGRLLAAYYRIMKTHMKDPKDLSQHVYFPFRLSQQTPHHQGLAAEQAIAHTLQWRTAYRPFKVTPSVLVENAQGFCYHRGLARTHAESPGAHAMIWNRAGRHKAQDPLAYFRTILNAADRAVAEALSASNGKVGKFNVVIDASGYSWGSLPAIHYTKQAVTMLQDHYPDRLGAVFLVNFSRAAEFCINIIKPLLTKEVREKLFILPHDSKKLLHALESVVDRKSIPTWLGGDDEYQFDVEAYYPTNLRMTEEEGKEFLKTMPYHA